MHRYCVVSMVSAALLSACGGATTHVSTGIPAAGANAPWTCAGASTARAAAAIEAGPVVEPRLPVTVTDRSGVAVTVSDASRILALDTYGTLASTVYALGLGDRLVGRDISTGIPGLAGLPVVTVNGHDLNAEAIVGLEPTVVLTDYTIGPLEVQLQLRDLGIPVVILDDRRTEATISTQIVEVAEALGLANAGRALADRVADEIAETQRWVKSQWSADGRTPPRAAFLYLRGRSGTYDWFGDGTGADDLIEALGAADVASESGVEGHQPLNAEGLAVAAPDVLLVMTDGLSSVGGVDGLVTVPGVAETPAGLTRCIVDMADTQILSFGVAYPETVRSLVVALQKQATP